MTGRGLGKFMLSDEVRSAFLNYFGDHDHTVVPSSPLVPMGDPTLLFTNAGMVQFKDVFLGYENRSYRRATTSQKCVRAGGKHNDLDNVGFTKRHHTFFEMLGNFSFGDYFKEQAIMYAWDFLTRVLELPKDRLYVTIYREDDEAEALWKKIAGLSSGRIIRLGEKDNFWAMGDTGPCGPCSEIVIDRGEDAGCGPDCQIGVCDCDRWLELWNLVFMQFMRDESGNLSRLPKPSIDTGMGLERITSVLQGKDSNFETDLFMPIIQEVQAISGKEPGTHTEVFPFRVIADHVRACVFLASDGVIPSNEGRGYVMRRILRRAVRYGQELGIREPFMGKLVPVVCKIMGGAYPELWEKVEYIEGLLTSDEVRFQSTLGEGEKRAQEMIERIKDAGSGELPGRDAFVLYDTFGFPIDLTKDIARKSGLSVDEAGFDKAMREQRERSRRNRNEANDVDRALDLTKGLNPTVFLGYEELETETTVNAIVLGEQRLTEMESGDEALVVLGETPFYAVSGGQEFDTGTLLIFERGEAKPVGKVLSVVKSPGGVYLHKVRAIARGIMIGQRVVARVDVDRRRGLERHHTATHLLHKALRMTLGEHAHQSGSLVQEDRLRFDFTHFAALTREELSKVEETANRAIMDDLEVSWSETSLEEARKDGAIALFDEKYGEKVRVVDVSCFSKELCGGTHVRRTGEIGQIQIISETAVAAGIRRIEAVAGQAAYKRYIELRDIIDSLSSDLGVSYDEVPSRVRSLLDTVSALRKEAQRASESRAKDVAREIAGGAILLPTDGNLRLAVSRLDNMSANDLRSLGDRLKDLGCAVVVLGSLQSERCFMLAMVKDEARSLGVDAREIVKAGASVMGGSGGGKPEMAQAGGKNPNLLDRALEAAKDRVLTMFEKKD